MNIIIKFMALILSFFVSVGMTILSIIIGIFKTIVLFIKSIPSVLVTLFDAIVSFIMTMPSDFAQIMKIASNNKNIVLIVLGIGVLCALLSIVVSKTKKDLIEDVIFGAIFSFVFNIFGLLFVTFRKPVWNNLGWIPVIVAWFVFNANDTFAFMLVIYAIVWAISQHIFYDRVKVIEE